jgi:hypothetical protein
MKHDQRKKDNLNFTHWRWENDCEREAWGQRKLSDEEAEILFFELEENGWLKNESHHPIKKRLSTAETTQMSRER